MLISPLAASTLQARSIRMLDSRQAPSSPPRPSVILRPGMPSLPPGVERYRVRGGGSVAINIFAGDEVVVTDLEGLQSCDLLAMDGGGRCDACAGQEFLSAFQGVGRAKRKG